MNIDDSVFAIKLYEMEEQYGKLQCRIRICEQGGRDKIHSELQKAREEYKENTLLLEEKAKTCRSQAVTRLTQAQLDYRKKIGENATFSTNVVQWGFNISFLPLLLRPHTA